jgi:hypothetical protein
MLTQEIARWNLEKCGGLPSIETYSCVARVRMTTPTGDKTLTLFHSDIIKMFSIPSLSEMTSLDLEDKIIDQAASLTIYGVIFDDKLPTYSLKRKNLD